MWTAERQALFVFLISASAIGYLIFPSVVLNVVGITSNEKMDFLVQTSSTPAHRQERRPLGRAMPYHNCLFVLMIVVL
jgi:hypothetical protein